MPYRARIVLEGEVGIVGALHALLGLAEVGRLAHVGSEQLLLERLVRCLREHALLFQDGQDTHGLEEKVVQYLHINR